MVLRDAALSAAWTEILSLRLSHPLDLRPAAVATDALRRVVLSHAGDNAPAALHGHGDDRHCAWLALPNVGHVHADAAILAFSGATAASTVQRRFISSVPRSAAPAGPTGKIGARPAPFRRW